MRDTCTCLCIRVRVCVPPPTCPFFSFPSLHQLPPPPALFSSLLMVRRSIISRTPLRLLLHSVMLGRGEREPALFCTRGLPPILILLAKTHAHTHTRPRMRAHTCTPQARPRESSARVSACVDLCVDVCGMSARVCQRHSRFLLPKSVADACSVDTPRPGAARRCGTGMRQRSPSTRTRPTPSPLPLLQLT